MKIKALSLLAIFLLTACGDPLYKGGGFGGLAGDGNSIITISGYVMSTATFQSTSAQLAGLEGESAFVSSFSAMMSEYDDPSILIGGVENVADACAGAQWSMTFVGSGGASAGSGYAAGDGSFDVPSIPEGKEAVINFNCSGMAQKCLVKAGDTGITCNAIADGVVGALEASIGKDLSDSSLSGKTIAKVATSIVESAKTDSTDSDTLKQAILVCKDMPMNTLAQLQAKKDCYKSSLDSSSMSGTLDIVKTLTQQWTVRNLFNFMTTTLGHDIYLDNLTYTTFGAKLDDWLDTDFIAQTRAYIADIVTYPDYVNGDMTKGDQVTKVECVMDYQKQQNDGKIRYRPAISDGVPNCNNISELENIAGITIDTSTTGPLNPGKLLNIFSQAIVAGGNNHQEYQVGAISAGSAAPCGAGAPSNSFCLKVPELVITSKASEPNRNDTSGKLMGDAEYDFRVSLIDVFEEVMGTINTLFLNTAYIGHPQHACMNTPATVMIDPYTTGCSSWAAGKITNGNTCFTNPSMPNPHYEVNIATQACNTWVKNFLTSTSNEDTPYQSCIKFPEGAPPFKLGVNDTYVENSVTKSCSTWAGLQVSPLRNNFAGLMGLYLYLKNPNSYANGGSAKFSLHDIHRIFSKADFFNVKLTAFSMGFNWKNFSQNGQMYPPIVDVTGSLPKMQSIFQTGNNTSLASTDIDKGDLLNHYDLTFSMFENIPTSQTIRSYVDYSSHHEEWNPYGAKYFYVPGIKVNSDTYPIYCKMVNRYKNNMPMQKELNPSSKIICTSNPSSGVTAGTGENLGFFTYLPSFDYPYILQMRGFNGDAKGKIFALADRLSGDTIKVGGREIYLLEAHSGNTSAPSIFVSGNYCTSNPDESGSAPLTRIKLSYGFGTEARQDIVDAYCLNSSFFPSNSNATPYNAGTISFTMTDNNGVSHLENWQKAGGKNSSGQIGEYCFYTASNTFTDGTGGWSSNYSQSSNFSQITSPFNFNRIHTLYTGDAVDLCSSTTQTGKVKFYLTHFYDGNVYTGATRGNMPVGLFSATGNKPVFNWTIALSALESKTGNTVTFANSVATTKFENLKMMNRRHNPKFDPFCDDDDDHGCRCFIGNTNNLRADAKDCNLYDTPAKLTFSKRVFDPMNTNQRNFIMSYKNMYGNELSGLTYTYMTNNGLANDEFFTCYYLAAGEPFRRKPTSIDWSNLSSNHSGCPSSNGQATNQITSGPIRVVNPKPMKNAFDIGQPKTVMNLINYATKTIGQGVSIDPYAKVLSFDEALALMVLRIYLPPQDLGIYNPSGTFRLMEASPRFLPIRGTSSSEKETSTVTEIVRAIAKPVQFNQ